MNAYKITGTSRKAGAIGISETFVRVIQSESARSAYLENQIFLYAKDRDHVLTTRVQESKLTDQIGPATIGSGWVDVAPEIWLYPSP